MLATVRDGPLLRGVSETFRTRLKELKQRGCTVVVSGAVSESTAAVASRSLFGEIAETGDPFPPRKRVLGLTDNSQAKTRTHLPGMHPLEEPNHWVIDLALDERSVPKTASKSVDLPGQSKQPSTLTDLLGELTRGIDYYATRNTLSPAELRVGVNSLGYLIETHGLEPVESEFLSKIADQVRSNHGMGHFVCRTGSETSIDADTVETLLDGDHIDMQIRLRKRNGLPAEQQFHIPGYGTTDWVRL